MPYNDWILDEAVRLDGLGPDALEREFYPLYANILKVWFPPPDFRISHSFPIRRDGLPD